LPADLYVWTLGLVADGVVPAVKLKSLKFEPPISEQIWGLSHLWYLLYAFLYVAVIAAAVAVCDRWSMLRRWAQRCRSPYAATALWLVACLVLVEFPEVVWGFQHAFLPVPSKLLYSGMFFFGGWWLAAHDPRLNRVSGASRQLIPTALVLWIASVVTGQWYLRRLETAQPISPAASTWLAIATATAAITVTLALVAAGLRAGRRESKTVRYLAGASFWIYLVHHPIVGLLHIDLKYGMGPLATGEWSPIAKWLAAFSLATAWSVATYEVFVRRTRLSVWLGGAAPKTARGGQPNTDRNRVTVPLPKTADVAGDSADDARRAA